MRDQALIHNLKMPTLNIKIKGSKWTIYQHKSSDLWINFKEISCNCCKSKVHSNNSQVKGRRKTTFLSQFSDFNFNKKCLGEGDFYRILFSRDCKRNFKWPCMQRGQQTVFNVVLKPFCVCRVQRYRKCVNQPNTACFQLQFPVCATYTTNSTRRTLKFQLNTSGFR